MHGRCGGRNVSILHPRQSFFRGGVFGRDWERVGGSGGEWEGVGGSGRE